MSLKNVLILNSNFNEIYSEVGGLLYLFEQGYVPDIIIATSFSSITGALLAKEPTIRGVRDIIDFYKFLKKGDFLSKSLIEKLIPTKSYYSPKNLENKLRRVLPESFKLLKIPIYIIAYDLKENNFKIFGKNENDNVINSIIASISIPGIYKTDNYISACLFPSNLVEFALELGANSIYYITGDYNKLSNIISKDYKLLLTQNYKEFFEEINEITSNILIYEIKLNRNLFDFSEYKKIVDEGYQETRKKYIYYKLFRYGRVKETLNLLKRPDLSDEEKIIKAYAIYLEGDIPQAYVQFSELYSKFPDNVLVINGYANTLIDIGEIEQAGEILESYKNKTNNPYFFDTFSRYYFYKGEIDKALEYLKIAMNYAKSDQIAYNLALIHYGIIMSSLGKNKEALDSFLNACNNLKYLDNAYYSAFAYANTIYFYIQFGEFQKIEMLKSKIEELLELSGSSRTKFLFYSNYAYSAIDKKDILIQYIKKALDIALEKGDNNLITLALDSIANAYIYIKEIEKAEVYAKEALKLSQENNLFYNFIKALRTLIQIKILLNKLNEAEELLSVIPEEKNLTPVDVFLFDMLKLLIYHRLNENEKMEEIIEKLKPMIKDMIFSYTLIHDELRNEIIKILLPYLDIKDIISSGPKTKEILSLKLESEPKSKIEFLEQLKVEDSINYIEEIKKLANDQKLKIHIEKFVEHWRKVCEQYITLLGETSYFFNNELKPLSVFGDELNFLILVYLLVNRNKVITYGNISLTFGIHSENIKPRIKTILEVIEPWIITQSPKYLIIEEDRILFRTDENFKVDLHLFEDYLEKEDLENAINLYHGDFVPNITHPFFSNLRSEIKKKYLNAVYELANKYISEKAYDRAIFILESLLNRDIFNVEHLKLLISTLYKIGKRAYAYEWYLKYLSTIEEPKFKFEEVIV
ncbi:MAG: tetratricopeptide repeat protein [candidate division WOR-3 bacterium]